MHPCTFRNWSSIQVRKKRKKNLNYMWSFASRSQLINCFPFCLYQNCKEIRSHSGADSVFWSCGSFKVFHHQFSTIYFGRRQWKKLIRKMCVCTQQKEQDSRGRGRTFPDSFCLRSNSGTTLEGLISPFFFCFLSIEGWGWLKDPASYWEKISTQIRPQLSAK